jgi:hypothetical protein
MRFLRRIFFAVLLVSGSGCSPDDSQGSGASRPTGVVPDFQLKDENPNSPLYGQVVSPRDHLQKVSGWYFLHAT